MREPDAEMERIKRYQAITVRAIFNSLDNYINVREYANRPGQSTFLKLTGMDELNELKNLVKTMKDIWQTPPVNILEPGKSETDNTGTM